MSRARRLASFEALLADRGFAAAVISERRALFYFTGTAQPCNLVVVPGARPMLFARRALDWVRGEVEDVEVREGATFAAVSEHLAEDVPANGTVGLELDALPARIARSAERAVAPRPVQNVSPLVYDLRMVKDAGELDAIRSAAELFRDAHGAMLEHVRPGIAEHELSAEVARAVRRAGHEGVVFYRRWDAWLQPEGIVTSGENLARISGHAMSVTGVGLSSSMPWGASRRRLEPGDGVYLDLGLNLAGYHADAARTYVVGEATEEQERLFAAVLRCFDETVAAIRPGLPSAELYRVARRVIDEEGLSGFFQGYPPQQGEYIGHGLGLELDEPPTLWPHESVPLAPGMALAIEPKIISPAFGAFGVEETVVVTEEGATIVGPIERRLFSVS